MATFSDNNNNNKKSSNNNNSSKVEFIWNTNNGVFQPSSTANQHDGLHVRPENVGFESNPKPAVPEGSGKSGGGGTENSSMQSHHPIRPGKKDCLFFVHTGLCSFGPTCRFNHPTPVDQERNNGRNSENSLDNSTRMRRIPCKFYLVGNCKFGTSCRFKHAVPPVERLQLQPYNSLGLPFRWGKRICSFYMRTGLCGFGGRCKFHHPEPIYIKGPENRNPYASGEAMEYANGSTEMTNGAYIIQFPDSPQPYVATPMVDHTSFQYLPATDYGWNGYQVPEPTQEMQFSSPFQAANFSSVAPKMDTNNIVDFPPLSRPVVLAKTVVDVPKTSKPFVPNEVGLPMRPGRKVCWHYKNTGECKFGAECIFDHPQKSCVEKGSTSKSSSSGDDETPETRE